MPITIAFDVYGTLIDTAGVTVALKSFAGDRAAAFSSLWREKQLEYSFRRGLMRAYVSFKTCTRQALDYTCAIFQVEIPSSEKERLMSVYAKLPVFEDVQDALEQFSGTDCTLFAFSNGMAEDVRSLLENSGIDRYFQDVVSVDEIRSFKPDPAVYAHYLNRSGSTASEAWLVSGNSFDVIGALSAGMKAAWVRRNDGNILDPWGVAPTVTIRRLTDLRPAMGLG